MSAEARANGWDGFNNIGDRVEGGYLYYCDGMPTMMGCSGRVIVSRKWARVGKKKSGWLVIYGADEDGTDDKDVVLTFCPDCRRIVEGQELAQSKNSSGSGGSGTV